MLYRRSCIEWRTYCLVQWNQITSGLPQFSNCPVYRCFSSTGRLWGLSFKDIKSRKFPSSLCWLGTWQLKGSAETVSALWCFTSCSYNERLGIHNTSVVVINGVICTVEVVSDLLSVQLLAKNFSIRNWYLAESFTHKFKMCCWPKCVAFDDSSVPYVKQIVLLGKESLFIHIMWADKSMVVYRWLRKTGVNSWIQFCPFHFQYSPLVFIAKKHTTVHLSSHRYFFSEYSLLCSPFSLFHFHFPDDFLIVLVTLHVNILSREAVITKQGRNNPLGIAHRT